MKKVRLNSKTLLSAIVDSSDDAIISKTLDGIITSWNRGAQRMYGYSVEEVVGKSILLLVPPERREEIPAFLDKIRRGEHVDHFKSIRVAKDGRRLNVSVTISPVRNAQGEIVGASTIARDITPLDRARQAIEESESKAHAIFQAATQAIFLVDQAGFIVMANPATERLFGYSIRELIGKPIDMLVPERLRAQHTAHRQEYFEDPQMRPMGVGRELQARRKDGSEFFVEISLSYIRSSQGTLAVALLTDISKRREDAMAIRRQGEELRTLATRLMTAQDDERRRIARDLHDDLSQHLAFLAMDLGKLATQAEAQGLLKDIRPLQLRAAEGAESVRRISHQLHSSVLEDIGLDAALEQYCEEFEARSGIATRFRSLHVPDGLPREISNSLYHIAQECLRNVAKHSRSKDVCVDLECVGNALRLTIADRGVGLPERRAGAPGIGLVAMRERAHLVNGKISVESNEGAGTRVSVEVPISLAA